MKTKRKPSRYKTQNRIPRRIPEKMEQVLELPVGSLTGAARIELMGNRRAVIEECRGIIEYGDDIVRLNTGSGIIRITGHDLSLTCLTEDTAVVSGRMVSIEFLS